VQELIARVPGWLAEASEYTERWFDTRLTSTTILRQIANAQADVSGIAANVASVGAFVLGLIFQVLTIGLFTFYFVADGPRFRRGVCSLLPPRIQVDLLAAWEVAIDKTGGYLYSRLLLALINATISFAVLQALGVPFAAPLALWQGFVSQFIPVVGTYIAAAVPLLVALLEDPWKALIFLIFVVIYQQIENYLLAPRITAKTMQLHPAVAFGAALAGASLSGLIGAFMALPAAAVIQSTVSNYLKRHEVVENELTREDEIEVEEAKQEAEGDEAGARRWIRRFSIRTRDGG
jgi:predicted PurR-regulated permease PerM